MTRKRIMLDKKIVLIIMYIKYSTCDKDDFDEA